MLPQQERQSSTFSTAPSRESAPALDFPPSRPPSPSPCQPHAALHSASPHLQSAIRYSSRIGVSALLPLRSQLARCFHPPCLADSSTSSGRTAISCSSGPSCWAL